MSRDRVLDTDLWSIDSLSEDEAPGNLDDVTSKFPPPTVISDPSRTNSGRSSEPLFSPPPAASSTREVSRNFATSRATPEAAYARKRHRSLSPGSDKDDEDTDRRPRQRRPIEREGRYSADGAQRQAYRDSRPGGRPSSLREETQTRGTGDDADNPHGSQRISCGHPTPQSLEL
ncbi:hypothetical protein CYMTET_48091 [Cymbomonas tetramitiformis]|uniref:Uncharacterized protein n=1 Tax=Cymbomonas tetramitiformis TaxID=36881 RepID=A0AAE0EX26_9CHLO|nr:hypothetical protein CYMTET_48091 [Cymbomonas tetramitiformis]